MTMTADTRAWTPLHVVGDTVAGREEAATLEIEAVGGGHMIEETEKETEKETETETEMTVDTATEVALTGMTTESLADAAGAAAGAAAVLVRRGVLLLTAGTHVSIEEAIAELCCMLPLG